ncbi:MAG: SPOR domain-containing protein, partial [Candidatus Nitrosotenuis sp.]
CSSDLVVLAGAGYYLYSSMFGGSEAPPPPVVPPKMAAAPEAGAPAVAPATPATPVKPGEAPAAPAKQAAAPAAAVKPGAAPAAPVKQAVAPAKAGAAAAPQAEAKAAPAAPGAYTLQLGVFTEKKNAEAVIKQVEALGFTPQTLEKPVSVKSIGIYTGYYRYRELAVEGSAKLTKDGFENKVVLKGPGNYTVEVGAYKTEKEADAVVKKLNAKGYKVDVDYTSVKKPASVVLLRNIENAGQLKSMTDALAAKKIEYVVLKKK